jgi:Lamin Tail Domain
VTLLLIYPLPFVRWSGHLRQWIAAPFICLLVCLGCGDTLELPRQDQPEVAPPLDRQFGQLTLALETSGPGGTYRLNGARFAVSGPESAELVSESNDTSSALAVTLITGSYRVSLLEGWSLINEAGSVVSASVRRSELPFTISQDETTAVQFEFEVSLPAEAGAGTLSVSISVTEKASRSVIFNELMINPAAVSDASGEWIELFNVGAEAADLNGCKLSRDTSEFTFAGLQVIAPGDYLTVASSANPGFSPDGVWGSLALPNSAAFVLTLTCDDEILDQLTVTPGEFSVTSGASLALSSSAASAADNDVGGNWCVAASVYGVDLGTPAAANAACSAL